MASFRFSQEHGPRLPLRAQPRGRRRTASQPFPGARAPGACTRSPHTDPPQRPNGSTWRMWTVGAVGGQGGCCPPWGAGRGPGLGVGRPLGTDGRTTAPHGTAESVRFKPVTLGPTLWRPPRRNSKNSVPCSCGPSLELITALVSARTPPCSPCPRLPPRLPQPGPGPPSPNSETFQSLQFRHRAQALHQV